MPPDRASLWLVLVPLLLGLHLARGPLPVQRSAEAGSGLLVLRDVTVIDATGAPAAPHRVVLLERSKIRAVLPLQGFTVPAGARVIEAGGRFLIPGLWDMHVHMTSIPASPLARGEDAYQSNSRFYLPLFVAWGVTGVRDMSGNLDLLISLRDSVRSGVLIGPRIVLTGFKLGSSRPTVPGAPFPLETEADVREAVRLLRRRGADFVKLDGLPRELLPALVDECRRQGLPFVGHLPEEMTLREASAAGQKSVEHLDGALLSIASGERELRARALRARGRWMRWAARFHLVSLDPYELARQDEILRSANAARAESLYAELARNGTWQVPALGGLRDIQRVREVEPFAVERGDYLPPPRHPIDPTLWEQDRGLARRAFARELEVVGAMHRNGVPLLAGTDTPGMDRVPGFSLTEELELLVRSGLSPMAALQAATREPARFLGFADTLGTIEPGKVADLVLLDGDPLLDIRNVHRVHAVILGGRYLAPPVLDSLRRSVRGLVAAWRDTVARQVESARPMSAPGSRRVLGNGPGRPLSSERPIPDHRR